MDKLEVRRVEFKKHSIAQRDAFSMFEEMLKMVEDKGELRNEVKI